MILPKDFKLEFSHQAQLTTDVYSFYFNKGDFEFNAGQHIKLFLPVVDPGGSNRSFSICSSPLEEEFIITTKMSESPFKKTMLTLSPGTSVSMFGPIGRMIVTEDESSPLIMLAGGIGITPFRSLLLYAAEKKLYIPITFFVSFSTREEVLFYDELSKVAQQNSSIKIAYTITDSESSGEDWKGEKGRISKEMIEKYVQNIPNSRAYIAGPPVMVSAMLEIVQSLGIPPEKTLKENFIGY